MDVTCHHLEPFEDKQPRGRRRENLMSTSSSNYGTLWLRNDDDIYINYVLNKTNIKQIYN